MAFRFKLICSCGTGCAGLCAYRPPQTWPCTACGEQVAVQVEETARPLNPLEMADIRARIALGEKRSELAAEYRLHEGRLPGIDMHPAWDDIFGVANA